MIQSEYIDVLKPHNISACKPSYCDGDGAEQLELVKKDDLNNIINGEFKVFAHLSSTHRQVDNSSKRRHLRIE